MNDTASRADLAGLKAALRARYGADLLPRAFAVFGLCVGYAEPAAAAEVKPRLPQGMVLHRGRYDTEGEAAGRAAYDVTLSAFSARQEMSHDDWTGRVIARIGTIAALRGRDRLRAALAALGFPLS